MADEVEDKPNSVYTVPVTKAKGDSVSIDIAELPDSQYRNVVAAGLKLAVNSGATKITKENFTKNGVLDEAGMKAAAAKLAREKASALIAGTFKWGRATKAATEVPHKVMVEARHNARGAVKEWIVASGGRVTHYKASAITEAANELLAAPEGMQYLLDAAKTQGYTFKDGVWTEAEAAPKVRAKPAGFKLPEADETLKEKAQAKAKVPAGMLSAAKAGGVAARVKH